jgi:hypothetical protein
MRFLNITSKPGCRWISGPSLGSKFNSLTSLHLWRDSLGEMHNCAYKIFPIYVTVFRIQLHQVSLIDFYEMLNGFNKLLVNNFLLKQIEITNAL